MDIIFFENLNSFLKINNEYKYSKKKKFSETLTEKLLCHDRYFKRDLYSHQLLLKLHTSNYEEFKHVEAGHKLTK